MKIERCLHSRSGERNAYANGWVFYLNPNVSGQYISCRTMQVRNVMLNSNWNKNMALESYADS